MERLGRVLMVKRRKKVSEGWEGVRSEFMCTLFLTIFPTIFSKSDLKKRFRVKIY